MCLWECLVCCWIAKAPPSSCPALVFWWWLMLWRSSCLEKEDFCSAVEILNLLHLFNHRSPIWPPLPVRSFGWSLRDPQKNDLQVPGAASSRFSVPLILKSTSVFSSPTSFLTPWWHQLCLHLIGWSCMWMFRVECSSVSIAATLGFWGWRCFFQPVVWHVFTGTQWQ